MLADEFKLRDGNAFVDAIVPRRAAIGGLVDAAVVAGVNGQMVRRMASEGVIIGVNSPPIFVTDHVPMVRTAL